MKWMNENTRMYSECFLKKCKHRGKPVRSEGLMAMANGASNDGTMYSGYEFKCPKFNPDGDYLHDFAGWKCEYFEPEE